jgi:tetratricopeptide (TPR) repeat protein
MFQNKEHAIKKHDDLRAIKDNLLLIKENPENAMAHQDLASALYNKKEYGEAKQHAEIAIRIDNTLSYPYQILSFLAYREKDYQKCYDLAEKAYHLAPGSLNAKKILGWACLNLNRTNEGVQYYEQVVNASPKDKDAYSFLLFGYARQKKYKQYYKITRERYRHDPNIESFLRAADAFFFINHMNSYIYWVIIFSLLVGSLACGLIWHIPGFLIIPSIYIVRLLFYAIYNYKYLPRISAVGQILYLIMNLLVVIFLAIKIAQ